MRRLWLVGAALPVVFLLATSPVSGGHRLFTLFDDAMISMAYARTLVETGELVWFPGADRVQGITNPLWTLYMALLHQVGFHDSGAALAVSLTGLLCLAVCTALSAATVRRALDGAEARDIAASCVAALVLATYPLVFWSVRGMEVALLAMLGLVMLWCGQLARRETDGAVPRLWLTGASLSAAAVGVLTRLDFAAVAAGIVAGHALGAQERACAVRSVMRHVVVLMLAVVAVLVCQQAYYGDALPNTYRLKIEGYDLATRLARGLYSSRNVLALTVLVLGSAALSVRRRHHAASQLTLAAAGGFVAAFTYSVVVGGDAWEGSRMANRYVSVAIPLAHVAVTLGAWSVAADGHARPLRQAVLACLLVSGLSYVAVFDRLGAREGTAAAALGLAAVFVTGMLLRCSSAPTPQPATVAPWMTAFLFLVTSGWGWVDLLWRGGMQVRDDIRTTRQSIELQRMTTPDALVATVWAGAPAYYSHRPMVDLLGKSDRVVASRPPRGPMRPGHNKWDYDYSIGVRRPDVILQLWYPDQRDMDNLSRWGYRMQCVDGRAIGFVRSNSTSVRWDMLRDCSGR